MPAKERRSKARDRVDASPSRFDETGKSLRELSQYVQFTPDLKEKFLDQLREVPNVARACRVLGLTRRLVYNHRRDDAEFAESWDEALDEGVENLEAIALERAADKSDILLMFMLKGAKPETYRERYDHTSNGQTLPAPGISVVEVHLSTEAPSELPEESAK